MSERKVSEVNKSNYLGLDEFRTQAFLRMNFKKNFPMFIEIHPKFWVNFNSMDELR